MTPQPIAGHQNGIFTVAIAAQLSFLATLLLIGILIYFRLRLWDSKSRSVVDPGRFCSKFLHSQFALLFIDLLVSDLIQALGFLLNLAHVGKLVLNDSIICTVQGVLIQLGDTSGAFATIIIAIHTFIVLIKRTPPSTCALLIVLAIKWALAFILAMIGPLALATESLGPFYGPAGGWCWIRSAYRWERLCLHYVWLYLAGGGSTVIYFMIFWNVRRGLRTQYSQKPCDRSAEELSMENAAKKMLFYPFCYLLLMLPLATDRTSRFFGHTWSLDTQIACGVLFSLAGLVDSVVFCWTRNLFSVRLRSGYLPPESNLQVFSKGSVPDVSEPTTSRAFLSSGTTAVTQSPNSMVKSPQKSLSSCINGSTPFCVPAKYSLATLDMNSFDDTEPTSSQAVTQ